MNLAKFPSITVDLERKIQRGFYRDRIPVVTELMKQYDVSRQTIVNAVKPLLAKKLLVSKGTLGTFINKRYRFSRKRIVIVSGGIYSEVEKSDKVVDLMKIITDDGNSPELLCLPKQRFTHEIEKLFSENCDGFLFINSSLTFAIATYLQKKNIPFVTCNYGPFFSNIDFVEFDSFISIKEITVKAIEAKYNKITLFFPGNLEGFNDQILREWIKIKKEFNLPLIDSDKFRFDWQKSVTKNWLDFQMLLKTQKTYPELIIYWGRVRFPIPESCLIIGMKDNNLQYPPNMIEIKAIQQCFILEKGYELLREKLSAPAQRNIRRFYEYKTEFVRKIPEFASWQKETAENNY